MLNEKSTVLASLLSVYREITEVEHREAPTLRKASDEKLRELVQPRGFKSEDISHILGESLTKSNERELRLFDKAMQ